MNILITSSYGLNSTADILLQGWLGIEYSMNVYMQ